MSAGQTSFDSPNSASKKTVFRVRFLSPPYELLRIARDAEAQGDLQRALRLFKKAYARIERRGDIYHPEVFTRLAMVLQRLGRLPDAWQHLCRLLIDGCPGHDRYCHPAVHWLDQAAIYDKMRLVLHRAGADRLAVVCGVWFYMCRYQACIAQPRLGKPGSLRASRAVQSLLTPLLHRADCAMLLEPLTAAILETLHRPASPERWQALHQQLSEQLFPEGYPHTAPLADIPQPYHAPVRSVDTGNALLEGIVTQPA